MLDVAKEIGALLLKGHAMLATTCDRCHAIPLLRDRQGREFCVACRAKDAGQAGEGAACASKVKEVTAVQVGSSSPVLDDFVTVAEEGKVPEGNVGAAKGAAATTTSSTKTTTTSTTATTTTVAADRPTRRLCEQFAQERERIIAEQLVKVEAACRALHSDQAVQELTASLTRLDLLAGALHMREYLRGAQEGEFWARCYGAILEALEVASKEQRTEADDHRSRVTSLCNVLQQVEALSQ